MEAYGELLNCYVFNARSLLKKCRMFADPFASFKSVLISGRKKLHKDPPLGYTCINAGISQVDGCLFS